MRAHDATKLPVPIPAIDGLRYAKIPYRANGRGLDGADCYGLVWLVYAHEFGIRLASFSGDYEGAKDSCIPELIRRGAAGHEWREVVDRASIQTGDVLVLRLLGRPCHVGIALDGRQMLHCEPNTNTIRESFRGRMWRDAIVAVYRHERFGDGQ